MACNLAAGRGPDVPLRDQSSKFLVRQCVRGATGIHHFVGLLFRAWSCCAGPHSVWSRITAKTFSHLLSQPAPRQRMWVAKALPLAIATLLNLIVYLLSLWLVLSLSSGAGVGGSFLSDVLDMFRAIPIVALLAYSGGLWTTVLFRTIPGALGITIVAPLAVLMLENRIVGKIAPHYVDTLVPWVLIIYAIGGIIFARWSSPRPGCSVGRASDFAPDRTDKLLAPYLQLPSHLQSATSPSRTRNCNSIRQASSSPRFC